jgi:hypothetical protein
MTQQDRDRLVALKKARKGLITQREAAAEIGQSERHVRRLLVKLKKEGDRAVVHRLRGRSSNRRTEAKVKQRALEILSRELYRGFGPTLASEYLSKDHGIDVSRETVRNWMTEAKLWRVKTQRLEKIHAWRARRSRQGELVQWDTSEHAWLEKRGETLYLISMIAKQSPTGRPETMIDDATSRLHARFVKHDSTEENMRLLWSYLERHGRPLSFYTDKAALFQTARKIARDRKPLPREEQDPLPAHADWPSASGTGHPLDWSAFAAGQRPGGTQFRHRPGSAGEGPACGCGEHTRTSQRLSRKGVYSVVEQNTDCRGGQRRRCASSAPADTFAAGFVELCGEPAGSQRLHDPVGHQNLSNCQGRHSRRFARCRGTSRSSARWLAGGSFPHSLSGRHRMSAPSQSGGGAVASHDCHRTLEGSTPEKPVDEELPLHQPGQGCALGHPKTQSETHSVSRAKPARLSSRLLYPNTAAPKLHQSRFLHKNQTPQNGQHWARFDWRVGAICFGASPVAAVFGSAPGSATSPEHRLYTKPSSQTSPSKPDISTLRKIGHFYFALTAKDYELRARFRPGIASFIPCERSFDLRSCKSENMQLNGCA